MRTTAESFGVLPGGIASFELFMVLWRLARVQIIHAVPVGARHRLMRVLWRAHIADTVVLVLAAPAASKVETLIIAHSCAPHLVKGSVVEDALARSNIASGLLNTVDVILSCPVGQVPLLLLQ